jgi:TrmH family RNA methyltransferase
MRTAVTSLQNDRVKLIRSLDMRKARRETGLFVTEGTSVLVTARDNGWTPTTLVALKDIEADGSPMYRDLLRWALDAGADVLDVSAAVLGKLAAKDNPQSMLAVFEQTWASPPTKSGLGTGDVWLALEEVRDPGNLGTIIRTVHAVGARGVILVGQCCDPWGRECVRATMGSIFAVPLVRMERNDFLSLARDWPGDVIGTHLDASEDFREAKPREPVLLVMGSEGPGMSAEVKSTCSRLVRIPMAGHIDSLNLAVATALALYQFRGPHLGERAAPSD